MDPSIRYTPRTPYPTRAFIALAIAWVALDVAMLAMPMSGIALLWIEHAGLAWLGMLGAKFVLLVGWTAMGEGSDYRSRAAAAFGLSPFVLPPLIVSLVALHLLPMLLGGIFLMVPLGLILALPYAMLIIQDYRLERDLQRADPPRKQFTVLQLMVTTFVVAVVLGVLRWMSHLERDEPILLVLAVTLGWGVPYALTPGLLSVRWYPWGVVAAGMFLFALALPLVGSHERVRWYEVLVIASYLTFFAGHLLLLRLLGYRLVQGRLPWRPDPGIEFLDAALVEAMAASSDEVRFLDPPAKPVAALGDSPFEKPRGPSDL
jgi:hypothetical protein